jgi:hypothetical protein
MTSADVRHLRRMLSCITSLRGNSVSLVAGAGSLLFLRDALKHVDADWDESFTDQIATLESAAVATDEQVATMGASYGAVISQALDCLEGLVKGQLSSDAALDAETDE